MNILFLCDEYPPCKHGGIGTVTRVLARELSKMGHNVFICGFYPYYRKAKAAENDMGVTVYRFFYGSRLTLKLSKHWFFGKYFNVRKQFERYLLKVAGLIRKHNIDVLEIPDYNEIFRYSGPQFTCFPDFHIPMVVKIHGGDSFFGYIKNETVSKDILYRKEKKLLDDADSLIAISEFSRSVIKKIFSYEKEIPVIYNGIDIDQPLSYCADSASKNVVFAGTITEKKGIFSLVQAWEHVIARIPDANLYIYGKGSNRTIKHLNSLMSEKIKPSVHMMGFTEKEKLGEIYSSATCAVFPSFAESFGMAPLEAMVTGCPTIFTERTSGPELITHGEEGLLIDPDDLINISGSIADLIMDREKALELGRKGAMKVRSHFDVSLIAMQHIELYKKLIMKKKNA